MTSYPLNNALQRQIDPPKWRVTHFRNPHVNLDGRRFAVTRFLTPLCIGKIETPDRSTLLAGDDACAKNASPAVVTPSIVLFDKTRCLFAGMVDLRYWMTLAITASTVLLSCVQDLKMWQNASNLLSAFPEVPRNTACRAWSSRCCGQASIDHFIHLLGEIANGLIAAASGACIC